MLAQFAGGGVELEDTEMQRTAVQSWGGAHE